MLKNLLRMNLQYFADEEKSGETTPSNDETKKVVKTYSEEEYQRLKNSFDKTSSELAEMKKEAKARLSEDEQKKLADQELAEKMAMYEDELVSYKLKDVLLKDSVFTSNEVETIIKNRKDSSSMLAEVNKIVALKIEEAKKQAVADFMKSSNITGGTSSNEKQVDSVIQSIIDSQKKISTDATNARKFYLGEKGEKK